MSSCKYSKWILLAVALSSIGVSVVAPAYAERKQQVLYEVKDLDERANIQRLDAERANKLLAVYLNKMEVVERADNNVRFLLNNSSRYTDKALQDYLNNEVIPRSSELISLANGITSQSSVLRELHDQYVDYVTTRHNAMTYLATYANQRVPATKVSSFFVGYGMGAGYSASVGEHKSETAYTVTAAMNTIITSADSIRRDYLNKRDYIARNKAEVLKDEK